MCIYICVYVCMFLVSHSNIAFSFSFVRCVDVMYIHIYIYECVFLLTVLCIYSSNRECCNMWCLTRMYLKKKREKKREERERKYCVCAICLCIHTYTVSLSPLSYWKWAKRLQNVLRSVWAFNINSKRFTVYHLFTNWKFTTRDII